MNNNEDENEKIVRSYSADAKWSIVASITAILSSLIGTICQTYGNPSVWFVIWFVVAVILAFVILLIFFYKSISLRKQREAEATIKAVSFYIEQKQNQYIHNLCKTIHNYVYNVRDLLCISIAETENARTFYAACSQICDLAVSAYNCLWHDKYTVSVCIKRIIAEADDYRDWQIETIARSANTNVDRINNENARTEPITVRDNADFHILLKPNTKDTAFACTNLENVAEIFEEKYKSSEVTDYSNTTFDYTRYYKSAIVVPIRIALTKTKASAIFNRKYTHHVVGFLCIDTEEIFIDGDELFQAGVDLAKGFADSIYKLFEDNIIYNKCLSSTEEKTT